MSAAPATPGRPRLQALQALRQHPAVRAMRSHPLLLASTALIGPRFMLLYLLLYPLLVLALHLTLPAGPAMGLSMGLAQSMAPWPLWVAPLGSLLITHRQRRALRLPLAPWRQTLGLAAGLLVLHIAVPLLAVAVHKPEPLWLLFCGMTLLLSAAVWTLGVLLPLGAITTLGLAVLAGVGVLQLLPWQAGPDWSLEKRSLVLAAVAAAAARVAWTLGRRFVQRGAPVTGWHGTVLDLSELQSRGRAGDGTESPALAASQPAWAWWPRLASPTRRQQPRQRLAAVLGPPYANSHMRFQLVLQAAGALAIAVFLNRGQATADIVPVMLSVSLAGLTAGFSQRLSHLLRRDTPELTELALLPGSGTPGVHAGNVLRVLCLRPLAVAAAMLVLVSLMLAWQAPAFAGLPLTWVSALGLLALETATVLRHGRPWFRSAATGAIVHSIFPLALSLGCWAALRFDWPALMAPLLAAVLATFALGAWRLRAAWQVARALPRPLLAEGDRAGAP